MKALLLAAGYGTRLRPLTDHTPKCLVNICGRPLMSYWLEILSAPMIDEIIVNTHYLSEKVSDYLATYKPAVQVTVVHEETLLGTAGTIRKNSKLLSGGAFLVAHADNLTAFDLKKFIQAHAGRKAGAIATAMTFQAENPAECGIFEVNNEGIVAFHEKKRGNHGFVANAAVYIFEPEVIDTLNRMTPTPTDISTELIPVILEKMHLYPNPSYHRDIGTPQSLERGNIEFRKFLAKV